MEHFFGINAMLKELNYCSGCDYGCDGCQGCTGSCDGSCINDCYGSSM